MATKAHKDFRVGGRELALAILCDLEGRPDAERAAAIDWILTHAPRGDEVGEEAFAELVADRAVRDFGRGLVEHVEARRAEIDEHIRRASRRWRLERMDQVDRNIIRLATAELLERSKTPKAVIVSEAVRLAGRYGSERSVAFVNGLVESIAQGLEQVADGGPS